MLSNIGHRNNNSYIGSTPDPYIVGVSIDGTVTAYRAGTATVTAYVNGKRLTCNITVTDPDSISEGTFRIDLGEMKEVVSAQGVTEGVTFASSNPQAATVTSDGHIIPVAAGTTVISATLGDKVYTYLATVVDPSNPYTKNAPYKAKEFSFGKVYFVAPSDWNIQKDSTSDESDFTMIPDSSSDTNVIVSIYSTGTSAPRYNEAKQEFADTVKESYFRELYDAMFKQLGMPYQLSNFTQSDYQADLGTLFKTQLTVSAANETITQSIYLVYIGKYAVQVTVTDAGDISNLDKDVAYMLNSFIVK